MRILLVEDETALGAVIQRGLEADRCQVEWAQEGETGLKRALEEEFDLVILDLMLPGRDGWSVCEALRERRRAVPILILTARGDVDDRVRGLEIGADDYLTKPFAFKELRARVRALVRRAHVNKARVIRIADLEIDTTLRRVARGQREIVLTPREYDLLEALARREGQILTREVIQEHVWGDLDSYSNTVEVHIGALRKKIDAGHEARLIHTIHRQGYTLRSPDEAGEP